MDHTRFDSLTRSLYDARSRRGVLRLLAGSVLGLLGSRAGEVVTAHDTLKKCKKIKDKTKKKTCVKKAQAHAATHTTETPPDAAQTSPPPPPPPPTSPPPPPASPPPPSGCQGGMMVCGGGCVDPQSHANHCGGCNQPCAVQAPETCGTTGQCVGGTCVRYGPPTICRQSVCLSAGISGGNSRCDGTGSCVSLGPQDCSPGRCDSATGRCTSSCSLDTDCDSNFGWCDGGVCRRTDDGGGACTRPAQCEFGSCLSGFCCESACTAANATGSCSAVEGFCTLTCNAGWGNCDNTRGCETDLQSHPSHCGGCNIPCSGPCGPGNSGAKECVGGNCFCTT